MKQQTAILPTCLQRFAWMVALVVVLRVVAWDLHHAFDLHGESDPRCQVCLVMERGGDGVAPVTVVAVACPCGPAPLPMVSALVPVAPALGPLPRGPPSSFS
ncbi:MAG TPA: hypothetical protein PLI48_00355 [Gammaproteobacteria bacterium]|nr:hypothetical protein [Gammaproteobacteria bacterium]HRP86009.1 hypothetical protein [Gammaproteobacteria bacterium]